MLRFSRLEFPICTPRLRRGFECAARGTYPCLLIWHSIRYTVFVITIGERSERCLRLEIEF
jgi:hypothetical protein